MTNVLTVKNFRSIKDAEIELGTFTVLNGENNSGKSSFLYALQVMKNIVRNPNQTVDELLNLHFLNLGGINETVFQKQNDKAINLVLQNNTHAYEITISGKLGRFGMKTFSPFEAKGDLDITFPYALNKNISIKTSYLHKEVAMIKWNGILADYAKSDFYNNDEKIHLEIKTIFEAFIALLNHTDITPTQRGFTKPFYNLIPLQAVIYTEDEVATLLLRTKICKIKWRITLKKLPESVLPFRCRRVLVFFTCKCGSLTQISAPNWLIRAWASTKLCIYS